MRFAVFLAYALLVLFSSSTNAHLNMRAAQTITEAYGGGPVGVRTGELLAVCLNENPSAGFRWTLEGATLLFNIEGNEYAGPSAIIGSGGRECWFLRAVRTGQETIAFRLWRHWEGDKSIVKRFEFEANVSSP